MTNNIPPREGVFDPHEQISEIIVVGLGGTGSQVARSLARIAYDLAVRGKHVPQLRFVDGDIVEPQNVGRQLYKLRGIELVV